MSVILNEAAITALLESPEARSRPRSRAIRRASNVDTTPICSPVSPISRTSLARIRSLIRRSLLMPLHLSDRLRIAL